MSCCIATACRCTAPKRSSGRTVDTWSCKLAGRSSSSGRRQASHSSTIASNRTRNWTAWLCSLAELVVTVAHRVGELAARWAVAATGSRGRGLARRARSKRCCP
eukprot:2019792-Prymnesium_polylepis.3